MSQPKVIVVIVTWNGLRDTLHCLVSLRHLNYGNWRAVLVDNGSQDRTVEAVRRFFPEVTVMANARNRGYVAANNQGITWALAQGADWILLLNNDVILEPDTLAEMVRVGESSDQIGIVGPVMQRTLRPDILDLGGDFNFFLGRVLLRRADSSDGAIYRQIDYVWGCSLMARASVFAHTGGLNPLYVAYYEDGELCLRARHELALHTVAALKARVLHKVGGAGEKRFVWQTYLRVRNHMLFFVRFARPIHLPTLLPALLFYHLPVMLVRAARLWLARTLRREKYRDRPVTLWGYSPGAPGDSEIESWLHEFHYFAR
jgi:GT2 family glycosyltransferase